MYIKKPTSKIKQTIIQLVISQFFQKMKSRSTNKQGLRMSSSARATPLLSHHVAAGSEVCNQYVPLKRVHK
jgi:hypothetical protein